MSASTTTEAGQPCLKWGGGSMPLSGPCVIGRRSDNDLQINNVQVSRRHALLMNYNDDWWLNDLGSRNGVLVNGIRLTSARRLRDGDEIRIANHRIVYHHSGQNPSSHGSSAGKTTQMGGPAIDETHPPAAACELIIANAAGAILEGEKPAHWLFGKTLERTPGSQHYMLPPPVREWLENMAAERDIGVLPLEINRGDRQAIMSLARRKEDRFFLLIREVSS